MRKELIAAASALALMTGAAVAQTPTPAPSEPSVSNSEMSGAASTGAKTTASESASAEELMGKTVYGDNNEKLGEVEDVILNADGQAQQLIVASGGFLGIGEKQVAIEYSKVKWNQAEDRLDVAGISQQAIDGMPEFEYTDSMTSLSRSGDKANAPEPMNVPAPATGGGTTVAPSGTTVAPSGTTGGTQ